MKKCSFFIFFISIFYSYSVHANEINELYGQWKITSVASDQGYKVFSWSDKELSSMKKISLTLGENIEINGKKFDCEKFASHATDMTDESNHDVLNWADDILKRCRLDSGKILTSRDIKKYKEYSLYCKGSPRLIPTNYVLLDSQTILASYSDALFCLKKKK